MRRTFFFEMFRAAMFFLAVYSAVGQPPENRIADFPRIASSVGQVITEDGSSEIRASGVLVSGDGLVVTCYHAVQSADGRDLSEHAVFIPADPALLFAPPDKARSLRLEPVRMMPDLDLALFRIRSYAGGRPIERDRRFPALTVGNPASLKPLDTVYILGFPEVGGDTITVVQGHVAGKDDINGWIKLDASVSRGFSGGAVVNAKGELVGIPTEIRADVEDVDKNDSPEIKVLYGVMAWVRPAELVMRLVDAKGASAKPTVPAGSVIQGLVVSDLGTPVAGALVGLLKFGSKLASQDNLLSYARTDLAGTFRFTTATGRYTLRIRSPGYDIRVQSVELKRAAQQVKVKLAKSK